MLLIVMGTSSTYLQSQVFSSPNAASCAITVGETGYDKNTQKIQKGNGVSVFITQKGGAIFFFVEPNNGAVQAAKLPPETGENTEKWYEIKDFVLDNDTIFFCGILLSSVGTMDLGSMIGPPLDSTGFIGYVKYAQGMPTEPQATYFELTLLQTMNKIKTYINNQGERVVVGIGKQVSGISRYDYFIKFTINDNSLTMFKCPYFNYSNNNKMELLQDIAVTDDYVCLSSVSEEPGINIYDKSGANRVYHAQITRRFDRNNFVQKTMWDSFRDWTSDWSRGYGIYDAKLEHTFENEVALSYIFCVNDNGIGLSPNFNTDVTTNNYYYNILFRRNMTSFNHRFSFNPTTDLNGYDYLDWFPIKVDSSDTELRVKDMTFTEDFEDPIDSLRGILLVIKESNEKEDVVLRIPCYIEQYGLSQNPHFYGYNTDTETISILKIPSSVYGYMPSWSHIIESENQHFSMIGVTSRDRYGLYNHTRSPLVIYDQYLTLFNNSCNEVNACPIRYWLYPSLRLTGFYGDMLLYYDHPLDPKVIDIEYPDNEKIDINCQY
ncbi:MAG: hypothetical protein LBO06_02715 [Bacteroidales bacterium]|jgi:hypothetical protein|nr:hypothetical protein [Bacteroidales bacterium]